MAYYLNYTYFAGAKYATVSIPASTSNVALPLQIEWEIEFEARKNGTEFIVASDSPSTTAALFFIRSGSDFEFRSTGNSNWLVTTGVTTSNWTVYKIRSTFNGTTRTQQLYINGTLTATRNPTTSAVPAINALFGLNNNANRYGDFKYFKFTDFVTPANNRNYDANASGGTGLVLPDTAGGVNGSLDGTWPAGNAQWVFYSSGSVYSDTLSGASFTSSGNTLSATASYGSTLNGGTYSSSGNALAVTRGYSSTLNSATFTSSGGNLSATRGYSSLLNGGSYSYLGNILTSTFSGAAQSFDDAMLGGVYSSSGNTLSSFVGMSSVMLGANYTSAGGSLSSILGYSSNLSGGVYSYSGNRLTSTWSGEVTVTIEGYTIMFADDSISALFGADNVSANFELDHVSVRWSN